MIPLHIPYYVENCIPNLQKQLDKTTAFQLNDKLNRYFNEAFHFKQTFFTKSCTHALETIGILLNIEPGDEVIIPSYTFVSTANAFALRGAKLVFADSTFHHPNVSLGAIIDKINPKTKAIVVVHYGGVAVQGIEELVKICREKNIFLIEDNAHSIGAKYKNKFLGTFGHASTLSFHESKNLTCFEGGALTINYSPWNTRADYIIHKGTNRSGFDRKKKKVYEWMDLGSDYKMDKLHLSILDLQVKKVAAINKKRMALFTHYRDGLLQLKHEEKIDYYIPSYEEKHNAHNFWITVKSERERKKLMEFLAKKGIYSTFHYLALHNSPYGKEITNFEELPNAIRFEKQLLRLPLYYQLEKEKVQRVIDALYQFYK